jgi:hypothetical protein
VIGTLSGVTAGQLEMEALISLIFENIESNDTLLVKVITLIKKKKAGSRVKLISLNNNNNNILTL